jgi:hypothetical protein
MEIQSLVKNLALLHFQHLVFLVVVVTQRQNPQRDIKENPVQRDVKEKYGFE